MTRARRLSYDVVVVGGGHNGLVAATYLARAGRSVLVLERLPETGGAAVSAPVFAGHDARLSRYSYLVSLMPERLMADLRLDVELRSRRTASYTPVVRDGRHAGLLVERPEGEATRGSFRELTGSDDAYDAWTRFYADVAELTRVVEPTLTSTLPTDTWLRDQIDPDIWRDVVQRPLGEVLEERFADDTVRGLVATDGLIGTFTDLADPSRLANRCFLYHLMGNGTGEWRVPVGGMGAVTGALTKAAVAAGAEILTGCEVTEIFAEPGETAVLWKAVAGGREGAVHTTHVLANVAPWVLARLLGDEPDEDAKPSGSQLKVNLLLDRLPRLRSGIDPEVAFAGTLHVAEGYAQLQTAYREAAAGALPTVVPGEIYCHSLTDPSILGEEAASEGRHTLTYFGVHTPSGLFADDPEEVKAEAVRRALAALDEHLEEPLESCVARDEQGELCIEAKSPIDIEAELGMPGGHIFHGDLSWPWVSRRVRRDTPAREWGVATDRPQVLLCGSGAVRGGAVSGLGGHNAAQAVLASG